MGRYSNCSWCALLTRKKPHLCRRQSIFRDSLRTHKIGPRTLTMLIVFMKCRKIFWFLTLCEYSPHKSVLKKRSANKAEHSITFGIMLQHRMREATTCDWWQSYCLIHYWKIPLESSSVQRLHKNGMTYTYFPNVYRYFGHGIYKPYKQFTEEQTHLFHASTCSAALFFFVLFDTVSKNVEIRNNLQKIF